MSSGKLKVFAILGLFAIYFLAACERGEIRQPTGKAVFEHDSAVLDEQRNRRGLDLKVTGFTWRYNDQAKILTVEGTVVNRTEKHLQGCRILTEAFDQFNQPLGKSQNFIQPTVLAPGKQGQFSFFLPQGYWVKAIRLHYWFEVRVLD